MVEDIPLEDLSLDDEEDDEERNCITSEEKSCRNLSNKKLAKVLVKKNYDEYKDGWGIDFTEFGRLSKLRMHKLMRPLIKEVEKESKKRKKATEEENHIQNIKEVRTVFMSGYDQIFFFYSHKD